MVPVSASQFSKKWISERICCGSLVALRKLGRNGCRAGDVIWIERQTEVKQNEEIVARRCCLVS